MSPDHPAGKGRRRAQRPAADRPAFDPADLATKRAIVLTFDLADPDLVIEADMGDIAPALAWVVLNAAAEACADELPVTFLHHKGRTINAVQPTVDDD